jgi:hypothetical protein
MRVMLVTPITLVKPDCRNAPRPEVGDIDIVTGEKMSPKMGVFYSLERFGPDIFYWSELFATLPDETADEMQEEEFIYEPLSC